MTQPLRHRIVSPSRIAYLRHERGYTIPTLATLVKVSRVTIMNWESGKVGSTSPLSAKRLAQALGVKSDFLFAQPS